MNTKVYGEKEGEPITFKKWVAVDELIIELRSHGKCNDYHVIDGKKATCLDVVLNKLFNSRPSGADNPDFKAQAKKDDIKSKGNRFTGQPFWKVKGNKPSPKVCPDCGEQFIHEDNHYYYTTNGRNCRVSKPF